MEKSHMRYRSLWAARVLKGSNPIFVWNHFVFVKKPVKHHFHQFFSPPRLFFVTFVGENDTIVTVFERQAHQKVPNPKKYIHLGGYHSDHCRAVLLKPNIVQGTITRTILHPSFTSQTHCLPSHRYIPILLLHFTSSSLCNTPFIIPFMHPCIHTSNITYLLLPPSLLSSSFPFPLPVGIHVPDLIASSSSCYLLLQWIVLWSKRDSSRTFVSV